MNETLDTIIAWCDQVLVASSRPSRPVIALIGRRTLTVVGATIASASWTTTCFQLQAEVGN